MNRLNHYAKYKVLVIDEVGFLPVDPEGANMLFQLINRDMRNIQQLLHHTHIISKSYRLKDKLKIDSEVTEPMQN